MEHKTAYNVRLFSSARSGRSERVVLAPPFLIYAIFGLSVLLQIPAGYIIHHFSFTLGMLLNQIGTLLIPVFVVIRIFGLTAKEVLPFKRVSPLKLILAVLMMVSLATISDYLMYLTELVLPVPKSMDEAYKELMQVHGFGSYMHKFLLLCLIPSFCEEIFFRGFCQTGLCRHYGRTIGIVIVAALFAIAHLSPWYVHLYFLLGLVLGWLFATSGTLWIPIACHITNNLWTFTVHAAGWELPVRDSHVMSNVAILIGAIGLLVVTLYGWCRLIKKTES